jgi:hypothetical protein
MFSTLELKAVLVGPVLDKTGKLRCEGTLHLDGRIATSECKVFDSSGRLIAQSSETCIITSLENGHK